MTNVANVLDALEQIESVLPPTDCGIFYYDGGYFSRPIKGRGVYGVGSAKSNQTLAPHNEMGYGPRSPRYIIFGASVSAPEGRETILLDGHAVYRSLDAKHQSALQRRKIRYRLRFDGGSSEIRAQTSWKRSFPGSTTPEEAVQAALEVGYHDAWVNGSSIRTVFDANAVVTHPTTGMPSMFDQIVGGQASFLDNDPHEAKLDLADRLHHTTWAPRDEQEDESELDEAKAYIAWPYASPNLMHTHCQ
eukprot:1038880-Amphidinium_carterae.1